ncbi:MAG: aminopeptidase P family protein [Spirochaetales bacterium]|nr:aminopeptidase P family protein [Spirochaetales bacterium]
MNTETIAKKIEDLRKLMTGYSVQAYIIPGTDTHQNEYIPSMWKRREWISGFSGSSGDVVITHQKAGLWTDSRYFIQAGIEIKGTGIDLYKLGLPGTKGIEEWLCSELADGQVIGIDPSLYTGKKYKELKKRIRHRNIKIRCIDENLVDILWQDRPAFSGSGAEVHPLCFCGESFTEKIARLKEKLIQAGCDFHVITSLDSVAWLFNIRGRDIDYNPLLIAYAIISREDAKLFISPDSVTEELKNHFGQQVEIYHYSDFKKHLITHAKKKAMAWIDHTRTSYDIVRLIEPLCHISFKESPLIHFKAIKNQTEITNIKNAHIRDGIAMIKFLNWLEETVPTGKVTELSAEKKLEYFRSENKHYAGPSFKTISAFGDHGAIVHYSASEKTERPIKAPGLFLVDSGAQYRDGTTDITRTIGIGQPEEEHRKMFTLVLKGLITLSMTKFPRGTKGIHLDTLARKSLWDVQCDYGHGTGHGVGFFLNVHEGPHSISPTKGHAVDIVPGMLCTIEPGYYKKGEYGIRIENIVLVDGDEEAGNEEEDVPFFFFKTMTLCPIDIKLIDPSLLTRVERDFVNSYHKKIRETLIPFLNTECTIWLQETTIPI